MRLPIDAKEYALIQEREKRIKEYNLNFTRKRQKSLLEQLHKDPNHESHGTLTGYQSGCRCSRCKEASRISILSKSKKRNKDVVIFDGQEIKQFPRVHSKFKQVERGHWVRCRTPTN